MKVRIIYVSQNRNESLEAYSKRLESEISKIENPEHEMVMPFPAGVLNGVLVTQLTWREHKK